MKLALAALLVLASCTVDRKSTVLACTMQSQCTDGRICDQGYCVLPSGTNPQDGGHDGPQQLDSSGCPGECTSCDIAASRCEIDGFGGANLACPAGWNCTIECLGTAVCGTIACDQAASCDVSCIGSAACGAITCGAGRCQADCQGAGACASVDCEMSCRCDVSCPTGDCGQLMCPQRPGGTYCTSDGTAGRPCKSAAGQCHSC